MIVKPKPEHEVVYQDLIALCKRHGDKVSALEVLAIASNVVGKLLAMQDQRTLTPSVAMGIVAENIEAGNRQVIEELARQVMGDPDAQG